MRSEIKYAALVTLLVCSLNEALPQAWYIEGQASGWLTSKPEKSPLSQAGLRYIPQLMLQARFAEGWNLDLEVAVNAYATVDLGKSQRPRYDATIKPYRGWLRVSTPEFEARIGLQKMSFGSATMLRPLMWFDAIDPRDPLQLTDGVYALLLRYYFQNNANIWLWGLYGNDDRKGWEKAPTRDGGLEIGGRIQTLLWSGELAASYHHRKSDLSRLMPLSNSPSESSVNEDRFGLDGKWDIGPGIWFESVIIHQETILEVVRYQRQHTIGADYQFNIGSGLTVTTEYLRTESAKELFGEGPGLSFSALSLNYPLGIVDRLSGIVYYDWRNSQWYRMLTWQRAYDDWTIFFQGYWNPDVILLYQNQGTGNPFAGTGIRLMVVFNH